MNTKLADLKAQSVDPTVAPLQDQVASLSAKNTTYTTAQAQLSGNASAISDMKIQLGSMAFAAANGDSAGFDQALAAANDDLSILQVTGPLPAFEPDGVPQLVNTGLASSPVRLTISRRRQVRRRRVATCRTRKASSTRCSP
jgi:hypothetical protein